MRRPWLLVGVALAAAAAWGLVRCGGAGRSWGRKAPRNLLLISIDTLRADRLGCYGYAQAQTPRVDALSRTGLRFSRAATVVPLTLPAHSSLMTGTFPAWHGVRDNGGFYLGDDQLTLAETLRDRGYRTGGFIGAFVLDRRWGIAQGFQKYFDDFDLAKFDNAPSMDMVQRPGSAVVDAALEWLSAERERPFFAWVHLYDPHAPYEAPEPYRSRFPPTLQGAYDAEIATSDALVGRLLDALSGDGRLDDTVVVIVGDHGEMLGEHGEQTHGFFVYDPVVHIPLIIAGPGVPTREVPDQVRIVDVMPTVLELLGVPPPKTVQGTSLMGAARGERLDLVAHSESWYPRYHYGWSELVSVQDGRFKYIRAPRPELYDLETDPSESKDLSADQAARLGTLQRALDQLDARTRNEAAAKGPQTIDSETEEKLQALGYVGGGGSPRHLEDRPRGDPKDKIELYNLMKRAGSDSQEGRLDAAIEKIQQVLHADPDVVEAYMLLGNFEKKAKRSERAIAAYRHALQRDPEHQGALFQLAVAYKDAGRLEEARFGFERANALDPRNGKVLWQMADLRMRQSKWAEAEAIVKKALAVKVDEHRFQLKLGEIYIESKRYDEAERALTRALELKPDLDTAHFNLGLVYEEQHATDRAAAAYRKEMEHNAKAFRAAFNLGRLLQKNGHTKEALEAFRRVVEIQPEFGAGHLYLAKSLLDEGDLAAAERAARTGLGANPEKSVAPLGHFILADVYNRLGRPADARREVLAARRMQRSS